MRPCSAYCEPGKGLHVVLSYADVDDPGCFIGRTAMISKNESKANTTCLPRGTRVKVITCAPATEAPPSPNPRYPHAVLETLQVLS